MEEKQSINISEMISMEDKKSMMLKKREKNANFCFTLAQLVFTAFVIGSLVIFFTDYRFTWGLFGMFIVGIALGTAFCWIANSFFDFKD